MRHQRIGEIKVLSAVIRDGSAKRSGPLSCPSNEERQIGMARAQLQALVFRVDQKVVTGRHRSPKSSSTLVSSLTMTSRRWMSPAAAAA